MRGFRENLADGNDRETDDRDEGEFIGPNPPGGRRTNKHQGMRDYNETTSRFAGSTDF